VPGRPYTENDQWRKTVVRLGARLRQLREEAGLTQTGLAVLIGSTGPGGRFYIAKIERGSLRYLGLTTVLDWLRACGRGFDAIHDIIDEWISSPDAAEKSVRQAFAGLPLNERIRADYYDIGMSIRAMKARKPEYPVGKRVAMAQGQLEALRRHRQLNKVLDRALGELHIGGHAAIAINLKAFGRKLFAMLLRTRNSRPVWRTKQLAALEGWADKHQLPPEPFRHMTAAVIAYFDAASAHGDLD
jgi:transcriptional regulator with XRE-family HTH domain